MKLKALILLFFSSLLLFYCAPTFKITQVSDKFSDPAGPICFSGIGNRLSTKSSQGGTHIDNKGIYIDPFVYKDRSQNIVIRQLGFDINHYNFELDDGFRPIRQIIFLTDKNERIVLKAKDWDSDFKVHNWNTVTRNFNTSFSENCSAFISLDDFQKLAFSQSLEAKIIGDHRSTTYEKKNVLPSFIQNLKLFYDEQLFPK